MRSTGMWRSPTSLRRGRNHTRYTPAPATATMTPQRTILRSASSEAWSAAQSLFGVCGADFPRRVAMAVKVVNHHPIHQQTVTLNGAALRVHGTFDEDINPAQAR